MNRAFQEPKQVSEFEEKVLEINRISRTVKGGRRIRFRALVIIGNRRGKVGFGVAKASEVVTAINKAKEHAKKHMIDVPIYKDTVPNQVTCNFGSANILIKPAPEGTSLLAGGSVRSLLELAGYKNIVAKSLGSNHKINVVTATLKGLASLKLSKPRPIKKTTEQTKSDTPDQEEKPKKSVKPKAESSKEKIKKETKTAKKTTKEVK